VAAGRLTRGRPQLSPWHQCQRRDLHDQWTKGSGSTIVTLFTLPTIRTHNPADV
jgi:hypothetical protein